MSSPWLSTLLYASQSAAIGAACKCGGMPNASITCWLLGAISAHRLLQQCNSTQPLHCWYSTSKQTSAGRHIAPGVGPLHHCCGSLPHLVSNAGACVVPRQSSLQLTPLSEQQFLPTEERHIRSGSSLLT